MHHYVYCIENLVNGKVYIGKHSTENMDDGYMGGGKLISKAIKKYGLEQFRKYILKECDSSEEAFELEKQLVTEDFVKSYDTYNLVPGGKGGWVGANRDTPERHARNHIRGVHMNTVLQSRDDYQEYRRRLGEKISTRLRILHSEGKIHPPDWVGRKHKEETKAKIGLTNSRHQTGSGNSQFGKVWIHNASLKTSKLVNKDDVDRYLTEGWLLGRKMKW